MYMLYMYNVRSRLQSTVSKQALLLSHKVFEVLEVTRTHQQPQPSTMAFIEAASGSAAAVVSTAALYPLEIAKSRLVAKVGRDRQRVLEVHYIVQ